MGWSAAESPEVRAAGFSDFYWFDSRSAKYCAASERKTSQAILAQKTRVDGELVERAKGARDNVECHPDDRKPARPVAAAERVSRLFPRSLSAASDADLFGLSRSEADASKS